MNLEDPTPHLERYATYEEACRKFRLKVPSRFNIAAAICRRHSDAVTRVALSESRPAASNTYTFGALDYLSDKFATALTESGITSGDVVSIMLRQSSAFAVAHFGVLKLGAVVQPLPVSASPMQINALLEDSRASALVVDEESRSSLVGLPASVRTLFVASDNIHSHIVAGQDKSFWREIYEASADFTPVDTSSNSPALIFSALGERGTITSAVHSHAALIASLSAFEMVNNFDFGRDTVLWASTDWASIETLLGVIYPAWYYGLPVIANGTPTFDIEDLLTLIEASRVTVALLPLSQLQIERCPTPREEFDLRLRRLILTDAMGPEVVEWASSTFGVAVDTVCSTLEAGVIAATCERWFPARAGSVGKPVPGRAVEIMDVTGSRLPPGERGRIAIGLPDPVVLFDQAAQSQKATASAVDAWFVTGHLGLKDEDGYLVV